MIFMKVIALAQLIVNIAVNWETIKDTVAKWRELIAPEPVEPVQPVECPTFGQAWADVCAIMRDIERRG